MLTDFLGRGDWRAASRRWSASQQEHKRTVALTARGESADTPGRQIAAAKRVREMAPTVAAEIGAAKAARLVDWLGTKGRERLIGGPDFEPAAFLELGLAVGRAVCLVEVKDRLGGSLVRGTGFLVAPDIVLTNHHVILTAAEAGDTQVTFDYRNDPYGRPMPTTVFALDPGRFFLTDPDLDCSFIAVGPRIAGEHSITDYCWLPLVGVQGKIEVGDAVNIIQHPGGDPMQWVIRGNRLVLLPELREFRDPLVFAHYEADTLPGSSGAPVMSRFWEVVALHHQAVPAVNSNGEILDLDGRPYTGSDESRVRWLGNEGIRVTALVRLLEAARPNVRGTRAAALESVLAATRPDFIALAIKNRPPSGTVEDGERPGGHTMKGHIEFTLPLRFTVSLGDQFDPFRYERGCRWRCYGR